VRRDDAACCVGRGYRITPTTTVFCPAASWTHTLESEDKQKHDFSNLVLEFRYAVVREDRMLMDYCEGELWRMYREKGQRKRQG
jgi:hypothetical protein